MTIDSRLLQGFLTRIAAGEDDAATLGMLADLLDEELDTAWNERADVLRQWTDPERFVDWVVERIFSPRVDQGAMAAAVWAGHVREVRQALAGKATPHRYPIAIRDARMDFRREVLSWFPGLARDARVSSRGEPPWMPDSVARRAYQDLHCREGAAKLLWKFSGLATAASSHWVCVCGCEAKKERRPFLLPLGEAAFRQVYCRPLRFKNGHAGGEQAWWIGQCEACRTVFWLTDQERALEDDLAEEERLEPLTLNQFLSSIPRHEADVGEPRGIISRPPSVATVAEPRRRINVEAYCADPPPEPSRRLELWRGKIDRGWRPNARIRGMGSHEAAEFYGVYIWEYHNVLRPLLRQRGLP